MADVKEITKKLEEGISELFDSEKYKNYLKVMSRFTNYSFGNCMLIALQKPDATLVAGFKSWENNFKRHVKKGEKAIRILAPHTAKGKRIDRTTGEETDYTWTGFHACYVFDVSQTEGEDLPEVVSILDGTVEDYQNLIDDLIEIAPVPVVFEEIRSGAKGFFSNEGKRIAVQAGMPQLQTIKTLVHETAHSILHDKEKGECKEADRRTMEVQAESIAYVVLNALGMDTSEYSFGYIAGWSSGKELKELSKSLDVIQKTAAEIINRLKKQEKNVA